MITFQSQVLHDPDIPSLISAGNQSQGRTSVINQGDSFREKTWANLVNVESSPKIINEAFLVGSLPRRFVGLESETYLSKYGIFRKLHRLEVLDLLCTPVLIVMLHCLSNEQLCNQTPLDSDRTSPALKISRFQ